MWSPTLRTEQHRAKDGAPSICGDHFGGTYMKLAGMMMLLAGWVIVISAVVLLLSPAPRGLFVFGGMCVEALGLVIAFRKEPL